MKSGLVWWSVVLTNLRTRKKLAAAEKFIGLVVGGLDKFED